MKRVGGGNNFLLKKEKNMSKKLQDEIDKTMESIEGLERVNANPYMFQRVHARIEEEANERMPILKVNYLVALLIIVLLNVLTLAYFYKDASSVKNSVKSENIQSISKEYNINTVYNIIY
jgi:hypothetical protein